jgi:2-keto-4-pentenoate hydratase/2-oxohepta-3-ene-1,7-dioic acid hydratase in catechol pathway
MVERCRARRQWQAQPSLVRPSRYCLPDDVVECEVEKIGVLRNEVVHI